MANKIFSQSPDMKQEYCASIVRIGEMKPIDAGEVDLEMMTSL